MYKLIFYNLYKLSKKAESQWNPNMQIPQIVAYISLSILQFMNFMTIYVFIVHGLKIISFKLSGIIMIILMTFLYIFNYYTLLKERRYLTIERRLDKDKGQLKRIKNLVFWIYLILTPILMLLVFNIYKTRG